VLYAPAHPVDASALAIDKFMDNVRKRHSPSLTAYYAATTVFGIMFAAVLAMAGMPLAWCAAFPLSMAMAALLIVQQRGGAVASIKLPGSRLLMVLQGCLLAIWGCGVLPTSVLLAPLPAVAIYFAAAHSVTRKLRPMNAGVFLLIILILAGSVPACFINAEVPAPVPTPTTAAPTAVVTAGRAAQMSRAYHPSPAAATSTSSTAAANYDKASMACAAISLTKGEYFLDANPVCCVCG
jgi:hypothetical protein